MFEAAGFGIIVFAGGVELPPGLQFVLVGDDDATNGVLRIVPVDEGVVVLVAAKGVAPLYLLQLVQLVGGYVGQLRNLA